MKKTMIGLAVLISGNLSAQDIDFNHSGGISYFGGTYSNSELQSVFDNMENDRFLYMGFTYNPRLDFILNSDLSLSLTAYPTYAVGRWNSYSYFYENTTLFTFELPVGLQLNYGNHSSFLSDRELGYFVMAGYNYGSYRGIGRVQSICTQAGVKFYIHDESFGVRLEYNIPISLGETEQLRFFGLGLLYNIYR